MADHMYVCVLSPLATGHIARRDKNDIEDALAETRDGRRRHRLLIHRLRLELIQTARHTQHTQHKDKAKRYSPQGMLACFDATPIKVLGLLLKRALTVTSSAPSILIFPSCSTLLCSALLCSALLCSAPLLHSLFTHTPATWHPPFSLPCLSFLNYTLPFIPYQISPSYERQQEVRPLQAMGSRAHGQRGQDRQL